MPPASQPSRDPREPSQYESVEIEPDSPLMEPDSEVRRRPSIIVFVAAAGLSVLALALGGYAWQLMKQKQKLESDVAGLEQVRNEAQQRVAKLVEENGQQQTRSEQAAGERDELQAALAATSAKLQALEGTQAELGERLTEYKAMRAKFQRMIDSGTLDISFRRGRMIVELPAAVLFDSGSAELSPAGRDAVTRLAKILREVPRHRFLVGGHTDNVPAVKEYKSNWELSAARAVRVTESLTRHGVAPKRLVIAGYAEFDPVAGNSSEAGRQKNRRIEIILEPYVEQNVVESLLQNKKAPAKRK
jgi:chemotaxis protein MotB